MNSLFLNKIDGFFIPGPERIKLALGAGFLPYDILILGNGDPVKFHKELIVLWRTKNDFKIKWTDQHGGSLAEARFYQEKSLTGNETYELLNLRLPRNQYMQNFTCLLRIHRENPPILTTWSMLTIGVVSEADPPYPPGFGIFQRLVDRAKKRRNESPPPRGDGGPRSPQPP